jgi:N-acetylmuramoyl-L-alanine amidase
MLFAHDPGHGRPPAVIGSNDNGICERDYVLLLARDIEAGVPWVRHLLLRTDETGPTYADRARAASEAGAGLVFCHHVNADTRRLDSGMRTFFDPSDPLGREVAGAILRAAPWSLWSSRVRPIPATPWVPGLEWTEAAHWVLAWYRRLKLPAVLVEWGYATSTVDARTLLAPASRPALVAAAAVGIARALEWSHPAGGLAA